MKRRTGNAEVGLFFVYSILYIQSVAFEPMKKCIDVLKENVWISLTAEHNAYQTELRKRVRE